jgi:hypothetical protein
VTSKSISCISCLLAHDRLALRIGSNTVVNPLSPSCRIDRGVHTSKVLLGLTIYQCTQFHSHETTIFIFTAIETYKYTCIYFGVTKYRQFHFFLQLKTPTDRAIILTIYHFKHPWRNTFFKLSQWKLVLRRIGRPTSH